MIVFAVVATIAAVLTTLVVVMANGMSDSPSTPFQGGFLLLAAWGATAVLWLAWWVG